MKSHLLPSGGQEFLYVGVKRDELPELEGGKTLEAELKVNHNPTTRKVRLVFNSTQERKIEVNYESPANPVESDYKVRVNREALERLKELPPAALWEVDETNSVGDRYIGGSKVDIYILRES